ncbi:MAG: proton-coupled thiamine transporter YuaJ [Thermoleophilia bacterium]|nr:proton-coupled thiamine transporter YuaJ [Thermoleophilia bacterium]
MVLARRTELVRLTEAAVAVALSVLLGTVRLLELPNGGSIALATLPLLAFAIARGVGPGVAAGACAGAAHALSGGTIVHPIQLGLDYGLAYAALGAAGLACGRGTERAALAPAIILAMALHLTANVVSGMVFFAPAAGGSAFAYSLAYNATTVIPELLLSLWLVPPLVRALARANPADSWRRGLLPPPRSTPRAPRTMVAATSIDTVRPRAPQLREALPLRTVSLTSLARPAPFGGPTPSARLRRRC